MRELLFGWTGRVWVCGAVKATGFACGVTALHYRLQ